MIKDFSKVFRQKLVIEKAKILVALHCRYSDTTHSL
mgnify:CR=1 FL=1